MKPEPVDCVDGCKSDDVQIQPLSPESNLIEIAQHSNPVVVVEKLDVERYPDVPVISLVFLCRNIFITVHFLNGESYAGFLFMRFTVKHYIFAAS